YGPNRARDFVFTFLVAGVITCAAGMWLPALAPMIHYAPDLTQFRHVTAEFGTWAVEPILRIRSGVPQVLSYCRGKLHVFVAALAVNGLMIAATPVYGGHYFIDIFAGAVLAVVAVALVVALDRPSLRRATAITAQEGAAPAQSRA